MFAGISTLQLSDNGQIILGMRSKEGEEIPFESKIKIAGQFLASRCCVWSFCLSVLVLPSHFVPFCSLPEQPSIHQWLGAVQYQMQFTLASLLERAVKDMTAMVTTR